MREIGEDSTAKARRADLIKTQDSGYGFLTRARRHCRSRLKKSTTKAHYASQYKI